MDPFQFFDRWYNQELELSKPTIPSACWFSTNGLDGYPNARFVSLKEVKEDAFLITGPLNTRKGFEVDRSDKAALTF